MEPIKYSIINNLTNVYAYSNHEELQKIIEYRRKEALGLSNRFASFGPEILKNLKKLRSGRTAGF